MIHPNAQSALARPCAKCNAKPGDECVTSSGRPVSGWRLWLEGNTFAYFPGLHAPRYRDAT